MGWVDEPSVAVVTGRASAHILTFFFSRDGAPHFYYILFPSYGAPLLELGVFSPGLPFWISQISAEFLGIHCICLHNNVMPAFFACSSSSAGLPDLQI